MKLAQPVKNQSLLLDESLFQEDPEINNLIIAEAQRQQNQINLIASENYTSSAVLQATGSLFTNKYAEGYPGKRYYGGCANVDQAEILAIERCKKLFGADHVNVQPHAGSQANMAVYHTILKPGDTILGMSLAHGGHLTHGHSVNFSGMLYNVISYGVDPQTGLIDYDQVEHLAKTHRPKLIIAGASAYSRIIDFERFGAIARSIESYFLADIAHIAGLIAAELHPNPFPHADFVTSTTHKTLRGPRGGLVMCKATYAQALDRAIMPGLQGGPLMHTIAAKAVAFGQALKPEFVSYQKQVIANAQALAKSLIHLDYTIITGGTDNHLFIVDLRSKNITGRAAEMVLEKAGITVSRSCIPHDLEKPWVTSGIRLGTAAITTRGAQESDMALIAQLIDRVILSANDDTQLMNNAQEVKQFCKRFML